MKIIKKMIRWVVYLAILAGLAALFFSSYQFSYGAFANEPMEGNESYKVNMVIQEGETQKEVAEQLYRMHMIKDPNQFLFRARFSEYSGKIKPGSYEVSPSMGIDDILKRLTKSEEMK